MVEVLLFDPLERALWILVIVKDLLFGPFFIYRGHKTKVRSERLILYGFGLYVLISLGFGFILLYLNRFFLEGSYINHSFYYDFNEMLIIENFLNIYYYLYFILVFIGGFIFIFLFERAIKSTRYLFSLSNLIFGVLIFIDFNIGIIQSIYGVYVSVIIFTWLLLRSGKKFQLTSVFLLIGINIGGISGALTASIYITGLHPSLSPALFLLSGLFVFFPLFVNLEAIFKSKTSIQWIILIIANCCMMVFMLFYISLLPFQIGILGLVYIPHYLIPIFIGFQQLIKDRKSKKFEIAKKIKLEEGFQEIIRGFAKHRRITEEEVSVSKEKQICIVCKNEVLRDNYICPECKTFYCLKCSTALVEAENACWVCDTPFDESKPSKPLKKEALDKEEKEVEIIDNLKNPKKK